MMGEEMWLDAPVPSAQTLDWFDKACGAVEVHPDNETDQHNVWISNGKGGHLWGGSIIATCRTENHARLVAMALRMLRDK